MFHVPAHKAVEHPAGQLSGNIGGELKLVKQIGMVQTHPYVAPEDQFIPDPFESLDSDARARAARKELNESFEVVDASVQSPEFYMAKIADTLEKIEALMSEMIGRGRV